MLSMTATGIETGLLRKLIHEELDDLVAIRHDLHAHPELGYQEKRTSEVVRRELKRAGVEFKADLAGGTGVLGHLAGGGQRAIGLRADMDALPIQEVGDREYKSKCDGVMHACGHDGHTTILIGTARVLARLAREGAPGRSGDNALPRPVTFVFQPAEEGGAGAEKMIADGCLDGSVLGTPVGEMFALHGWPRVPLGIVGTRPGPMMAAADRFDLTVQGQACHAAWPHVGRDPIVCGAAVISALQTVPSRNVNALDSIIVSVTRVQGGTTHNIIPGEIQISGTVRTLDPEVQHRAERRIREIAEGVARGYGCEAKLNYHRGYPPTVNDPGAVETFRDIAREAVGTERVIDLEHPVMGGEDFAYYGQVVPACFFVLGLAADGSGMPELHQPAFDFEDRAIPTGIEMFCRLALR
jgi:amidohydrolase